MLRVTFPVGLQLPDHYIFERGGGGGAGQFFSPVKALHEFFSPAYNEIICFVPLCTIFISSAKAVQALIVVAQPPSKIKWYVPFIANIK